MLKFILPVLAVIGLFAVPASGAAPPLPVVVSFSILGDMVKNIGGDLVAVKTLVGTDGDAHGFQPASSDGKAVAAAGLVFVNGLGFDDWMRRLVDATDYKGRVAVASQGVQSRDAFAHDPGAHEPDAHDDTRHGGRIADPHAWQDLSNGVIYAENIAAALIEALPARTQEITLRKQQYQAAIRATDDAVRHEIDQVPAAQRTIITSHDAFGYFGAAYGVRFLAPYGTGADSDPSAASIAGLIDQIKAEGVREIFVENMTSPRAVKQLAEDAGAVIGGTLYSDALSGPGGGAPDYLAMFKNNVARMKAAMLKNRPTR